MSSHSDTVRKAMASKHSEIKEATRTLLEDVYSDFVTMDVTPKTNKVGVIRNLKTRSTVQQNLSQKTPVTNIEKNKDSASKVSVINKELSEKPALSTVNKETAEKISTRSSKASDKSIVKAEVNVKTSISNSDHANSTYQNKCELNKTIEMSGSEHLQTSDKLPVELPQSSVNTPVLSSESDVHVNSGLLPLNSSQESSNVTIVPESFAVDNNLPSLAQLADAEIVQSGDNVSIIVSNPRFIEVLTNASTPITTLESGTMIEAPAAVLDADMGSSQIKIVDSSLITNHTYQEITFEEDLNLIPEKEPSGKSDAQPKTPQKATRGRGRPPKSATSPKKPTASAKRAASPPPSYIPSTPFTRGRRVTSRMKAAWTRLLEMDGRLVCQMPGCSQTFVTVANFQTHFKYCTGKKTLIKCDYCESMIFSTHKAILQHMEVEHPEKADEYKAAHQAEFLEFEKNNAPDHLIIAEDENVAMNIEEVTQSSQNSSRKRKLSEKESIVPNKKVILKHKLQSIQNSMAENAKEFKKCVRFDSITDKISSLEEACKVETPVKKTDRRIKRVFQEKIVFADKYFEDDEDVDRPKTEEELLKEKQDQREKMHTKARLMLNLERYKRYQEYLTVTRDWSSERKTYSRSRGSDVSAENSFTPQTLNESFQDIHKINNVIESSDISLKSPEAEINAIQMPPVETYQVVETPQFVSAVSLDPEDTLTSTPRDINSMTLTLPLNESELEPIQPFTYGENRVRREKTACYNRVNFETPKPKPRLGGIITYGAQIPVSNANKPVEPAVTFDSLVNFMQPKTGKKSSQAEDIENIPKSDKENGTKLPNNKGAVQRPKKKGRPSKRNNVVPTVVPKGGKASPEVAKKPKGHAKKYSAAMLKTIEKNVKNKKISKLFGVKKGFKSKKYVRGQTKNINLKNVRLKSSKNNLINKKVSVKKKKHSKGKTVDISAIQCQENIDNNIPIGQNIYTSTLNQLIVDANIAGEIEIMAPNSEQEMEIVANKSENICSEQINEKIDNIDKTNLPEIDSHVSEEILTQNIAETEIVDKEKMHSAEKEDNQTNASQVEKVIDTIIMDKKIADESTNFMQKETENNISVEQVQEDLGNNNCVEPMHKNLENNDKCVDSQPKDLESNNSIEPLPKELENNDNIESESMHKDLADNKTTDSSPVQDNQLPEDITSSKQTLSPVEDSVDKQLSNDKAPASDLNAENIIRTSATQQSDSNEIVEEIVSKVPIKRGRGRPRKNSKITPKASIVEKSQQKDHETEDSSITENSKICNEIKNNSTISETSLVDNLAPDDNKSVSAIRKSERVRRRKLVNDETFQTPTAESKQKEVTSTPATPVAPTTSTTPTSVTPTGKSRRGRPKKQVSPVETCNSKAEDSKQETPEVEVEGTDESLRKFSRKGRPRKCVRYADLNSGLESSESMDGTHNTSAGKDKSDSPKEKNSKNIRENEAQEGITELPAESTEQEENIVLPLKKRKQRQTKKSDSETQKSKQAKTVDEEILLTDEDSQNKLEENEDSSAKRNLRSRKRGTKRKKTDTSDEEWDPEVHLKSIGKSGRKSHVDLLELGETSDSSCSERRDSTFSKKEGDAIRKIASRLPTSKRLDIAVAKYSLKTSEKLFMEYKPQTWMWKILSGDDYILPLMKISPYFKIIKTWEKTEAYWNTLNLFDSLPVDKNTCHGTFFTGGPVTCSAWCPTPVEGNKVQYVALAVSTLINKIHSYVSEEPERGFIQLWSAGDLSKKMLQKEPFMEMSILHKYGPINDMAWCPYGCWENPDVENVNGILPRLGLLAVACSDSSIRIYSVPHPHLLPKEGTTSFPIYSAHPSVVLESLYGDMCYATKKSICVSLSWQKSDNCERIAAGYGCGLICVWHVSSSATVLATKEKDQIVIKPYLVFNGHGTPVLGLSFSPLPGGRFLVSASIDKTMKFWDLIDPSLPIYAVKKGPGKCAHWSGYYCGAFGCIQHGMNSFKGSTFFKECGTETISSRALSHPNCSIILTSLSDWLNALAIGDIAGNLSVSFTHSVINEHAKGPQYFQRYVYESELKPVEGILDKIIFSSYPESAKCIEKIQEMKEIALLMEETASLVSRVTEVVDDAIVEKFIEGHADANCQSVLQEVNEIVSVVDHIIENSEKKSSFDSEDNADIDIEQDSLQTTKDLEKVLNVSQQNHNAITAVLSESIKCISTIEEISDIVIVVNNLSDKSKEYSVEDKEKMLDECASSKLSGIADVVTVVTDIHDITETVDKLLCSSQNALVCSDSDHISSDISLMEIDDSKDLSEITEHCSNTILTSLDILDLLDNLIYAVEQNGDSCKLSNRPATSESIVRDIQSEGIACISIIDEMSNVVSVMENITESCSKSNLPNSSELITSESIVRNIQSEAIACISTIDDMSNIVTVVENMAESCSKFDLTSSENECKGDQNDTHNTIALPYGLSEMVDVISTVSDIQDTTEAVLSMKNTVEVVLAMKEVAEMIFDLKDTNEVISDLKDTTDLVCDLKTVTETILEMKDIVVSSEDMKAVISSAEDLKDVTVIAEKLKNKVIDTRSSDSSISSVINDMLEIISNENANKSEAANVMDSLISNIQMLIKSIGSENEKSPQVFHNSNLTADDRCVPSSKIPSNSSAELTKIEENMIDSDVPKLTKIEENVVDSDVPKNFDYQMPKLSNEMDEQMLSADSDSSSSDNDMDTDDEMEVDDSYMFDQDSNLSDDSILSECSLDSAASVCSFSTESDMSVDSVASLQGEQEGDDVVTGHQNRTVDTVKTSSESFSKSTKLTFEGKIITNSDNLDKENICEILTTNVSDSVEPSKDSNEEVIIQETNSNVIINSNVPDSQNNIPSEDSTILEIVDKTLNSCISEIENVSVSSQIPAETSDEVESKTADLCDNVLMNVSDNSDHLVHTTNAESEMPCDNSTYSTEIPPVPNDSSNETCIESADKNVSVIHIESLEERLPDNIDNDVVPPDTVENIQKPSEISLLDDVNNEQSHQENICISSEVESSVVNKKRTEAFSCYEDVISQYGIVFKDMNTTKFDKIEHETFKELGEFSFERYNLTSIKTVSWNPNHGSHNWLLSAGHSGIARLSYISDILQQSSSEKKSK